MLLVLIWYIVLERIQSHGLSSQGLSRWTFLLLPSITLIWTNLHGGFVVGIILLWIYAFGNYLTSLTSNQAGLKDVCRKLSSHFAWLSLACLVVTAINPYGFLVHKHIFDAYLQSHDLVDKV